MKLILFSIFCFYVNVMNSQRTQVENITLTYNAGNQKGPNSRINISIASSDIYNNFMDVYVSIDNKESKTQISIEKFNTISNKLLDLKPKDIIKDAPLYLDSTDTELSFSVYSNTVLYSVSGLNKGDEKTCRKHFLKVSKMILDIIGAKIRYVN